ncbi:MAG: hypothetical protein E6G86_16030 [Alphaproteobacteria bacterium]|nr:MAG: hypothetical protein E6G86_16030 [Alphaproteobacteria bacterium]
MPARLGSLPSRQAARLSQGQVLQQYREHASARRRQVEAWSPEQPVPRLAAVRPCSAICALAVPKTSPLGGRLIQRSPLPAEPIT